MNITKYAQSCILIETKGKRILIDPGTIQFEQRLVDEAWTNIDIILVTHKHSDHVQVEAIQQIVARDESLFCTSQEVVEAYPALADIATLVTVGQQIESDALTIEVVDAVHGYLPFLKPDYLIHENLGYIIDDGTTRAYHTSDTICFDNDYKCDVIFAPTMGYGLVMDPFAAALFAIETGAKLLIPVHYDNPKYPISVEQISAELDKHDIDYKALQIGESCQFPV